MITEIGVHFPKNEQFGQQEYHIHDNIKQQIAKKFPHGDNLIVNLNWFGPHFPNNPGWNTVHQFIATGREFDRIFWFCIIDPLTITKDQIQDFEKKLYSKENYYVGPAFQSPHTFHTHSIFFIEEAPDYTEDDVILCDIKHLYISYNRKPKPHRISLVEKIYQAGLEKHGVISLGKHDVPYDVSEGVITDLYLRLENDFPEDYTKEGVFPLVTNFGGVPYDCTSLGRLDIWQNHFLNVVSETEWRPWDPVFTTEKTLKPIVGMRPFVINGQVTEYQWLRDQGFKTFNHYFDGIEIENVKEFEVQDAIVALLKYLTTLERSDLQKMYNDMLPDLKHNRLRFFEFAKEQQYKMEHLFE
jgi:hypothetical protein